MDREQIKSERIVERYLSGDLTMRGAREFEQFCREHPEVLESLPIPARIKSQLSVKAFDGMGTAVFTARNVDENLADIAAVTGLKVLKESKDATEEEDDDDVHASSDKLSKPLLGLLLVLVLTAGYLFWQTQAQQSQIRRLSVAARSQTLRASGAIRTIKITPTAAQSNSPQESVSLTQAQWLDLHLDVATGPYKNFNLTVEKADEDVRILNLRRIAADTNKELRFALNSGALSAGDYEIKVEGLDYRGQPYLYGWVLIRMQ
jgi:hypothetical protein